MLCLSRTQGVPLPVQVRQVFQIMKIYNPDMCVTGSLSGHVQLYMAEKLLRQLLPPLNNTMPLGGGKG